MKIECVPLGVFETNAYLLTDEALKIASVVDAPPGSGEALLAEIAERGLRLESLLLTHGHWDHMADAHRFRAAGAKVCAHRDDRAIIETPDVMKTRMQRVIPWLTDADFTGCPIDVFLDDGDTVAAAGKTFLVRHVPGHCPGNILFYCAEERLAFDGDTIFAGSVGRTDLPGGDAALLMRSIREKIYTLPHDTVLFPGHGGETTVGDEILTNPFTKK